MNIINEIDDFEFLLELPIFEVLGIVVLAIILDTVFGVILALKEGEFQWQELPRFLGTNVLPYCLGLAVLGVVAQYIGEPFGYIYYPVAVAVFARYIAKIIEKIREIFGVDIKEE